MDEFRRLPKVKAGKGLQLALNGPSNGVEIMP
jgi:hypothetical protein